MSLLFVAACSHHDKKRPGYTGVVSFEENSQQFESKVMLPKNFKDRIPLVLVVHEWWGKNDYSIKRAQMLNDEGFASLPVDLYGGNQVATDPKGAMELAGPFYQNPQMGIERLQKYIDEVKKDPHVDPNRIYVIGYCFGGSQALNLARSGADIKGVVSFHGGLASSYKATGPIRARILVLNGGADPMVPKKDVKAFEQEMKKARADYKVINYKGATHAFTNPDSTATGKKFNIPIAYDKAADEASWREMLGFLRLK
jgi:dienelactone hydrolase